MGTRVTPLIDNLGMIYQELRFYHTSLIRIGTTFHNYLNYHRIRYKMIASSVVGVAQNNPFKKIYSKIQFSMKNSNETYTFLHIHIKIVNNFK